MAIPSIYTIGPAVFNGLSGFTLAGNENASVDPGQKQLVQFAAGQVYPSFIGTMTNEPMITFTCSDVAAALSGGITDTGLGVISTGGVTSLDVFFTQMTNMGTRASGSNHYKVTMPTGLVIPKTIKATQGQRATMDIECHAIYDGTNQPLTMNSGEAITA